MKVAVVVLNWNGKSDTLKCLESLNDSTHRDLAIIVVDNGSVDGSPEALRQACPHATVIENGVNLGYAEGNNVGMRHALGNGAESVLLLNNDTVVAPDAIAVLVEALASDPSIGLISPMIYYHAEPDKIWFGGAEWQSPKAHFRHKGARKTDAEHPVARGAETDYASGCALVIRSEVIAKIGLIDPRFFLTWEETDWSYRVRKSGYRVVMGPGAKVWHKVSSSFEGGGKGSIYQYYYTRNRFLWIEKNLRGAEKARAYVRCVRELWWDVSAGERSAARSARLRGARHYILRRFGPDARPFGRVAASTAP